MHRYSTHTLDKLLARQGFAVSLAPMLGARELARLMGTCSSSSASASNMIIAAMEEQHGLILKRSHALGDLRALEHTPTSCQIAYRRQQGHICHFLARWPKPVQYAWRVPMELKRGSYALRLTGWKDPNHGKLCLLLNGVYVDSSDWNGARVCEHSHVVPLQIHWTGTHQVLILTDQSNVRLRNRRRRYYMCIHTVSIDPHTENNRARSCSFLLVQCATRAFSSRDSISQFACFRFTVSDDACSYVQDLCALFFASAARAKAVSKRRRASSIAHTRWRADFN